MQTLSKLSLVFVAAVVTCLCGSAVAALASPVTNENAWLQTWEARAFMGVWLSSMWIAPAAAILALASLMIPAQRLLSPAGVGAFAALVSLAIAGVVLGLGVVLVPGTGAAAALSYIAAAWLGSCLGWATGLPLMARGPAPTLSAAAV